MKNEIKKLEERVIVDINGKKIKFSDMNSQLQEIAKVLYEKSKQGLESASYRLDGTPSDSTVFSSRILSVLDVINDFIAGEYNENNQIKLGSGKGKMSVGFGGVGGIGTLSNDYTIINYKSKGEGK